MIINIKTKEEILEANHSSTGLCHSLAWSKRADDLRIAICNTNEVTFWHPADITKHLSVKGTINFAKYQADEATLTFLAMDLDCEGWGYSGANDGCIYVWSDNSKVVKSLQVFDTPITALKCVDQSLITATVSQIALIGTNGEKDNKFGLLLTIAILNSSIPKSIDLYMDKLCVGLEDGTIYEKLI